MFETDKQLIYQALTMWANYIETGDCCATPKLLRMMDKDKQINILSTEQIEFVIRIRKLALKQLEEK